MPSISPRNTKIFTDAIEDDNTRNTKTEHMAVKFRLCTITQQRKCGNTCRGTITLLYTNVL